MAAARAVHDPGKVLLDVAIAVALGGDCLADIAAVRAQPRVVRARSPPTRRCRGCSRPWPAMSTPRSPRSARRGPRPGSGLGAAAAAGRHAGHAAGGQVIVDIDATLVTAHSDKEGAEPTFKRGFGFAPDVRVRRPRRARHRRNAGGRPAAREGLAVEQRRPHHHAGRRAGPAPRARAGQVLVRADTGGVLEGVPAPHHRPGVGVLDRVRTPTTTVKAAIEAIPEQAWRAAVDGDGEPREGAQVAELTAWMPHRPTDRSPPVRPSTGRGMRVIARRERPHPGAQLRLTDHNGWRITCFATNTKGPAGPCRSRSPPPQRARCEDRIRNLKDTGLRNLPFHGYAQNRIWLEIVALAADLLAWTQTLAFTGQPARRWEPKRLRVPDPGRRRTHRPHRPTTTPPAPTRLALEPPHRHRLDRTPHRLTLTPRPDDQDQENRRNTAPETPRRPSPHQRTSNHNTSPTTGYTKDRG